MWEAEKPSQQLLQLSPSPDPAAGCSAQPLLQSFRATLELFQLTGNKPDRPYLVCPGGIVSVARDSDDLPPIHKCFSQILGHLWHHKYLNRIKLRKKYVV